MTKQLSLWPTPKEPAPAQNIWKTLDRQRQKQTTDLLADLIKRIACPPKGKSTEEEKNDR